MGATSDELNIGAWKGVAIAKIKRGSIADRVGFEPGDIIVKINDQKIETAAALAEMIGGSAGPWAVTIDRGGIVRTFDLD